MSVSDVSARAITDIAGCQFFLARAFFASDGCRSVSCDDPAYNRAVHRCQLVLNK